MVRRGQGDLHDARRHEAYGQLGVPAGERAVGRLDRRARPCRAAGGTGVDVDAGPTPTAARRSKSKASCTSARFATGSPTASAVSTCSPTKSSRGGSSRVRPPKWKAEATFKLAVWFQQDGQRRARREIFRAGAGAQSGRLELSPAGVELHASGGRPEMAGEIPEAARALLSEAGAQAERWVKSALILSH